LQVIGKQRWRWWWWWHNNKRTRLKQTACCWPECYNESIIQIRQRFRLLLQDSI